MNSPPLQATQKGEIGITLNSMWYEPYSKSHHDKEAANSAIEFMFGWLVKTYFVFHYEHNVCVYMHTLNA